MNLHRFNIHDPNLLKYLQRYSQSCWLFGYQPFQKNRRLECPPPPQGLSCWQLPLTANGHFSVPQELYQSKSWNGWCKVFINPPAPLWHALGAYHNGLPVLISPGGLIIMIGCCDKPPLVVANPPSICDGLLVLRY